MSSKDPQNHSLIWTDLLEDLAISTTSWWQIITFLYNKNHGYSNYSKCFKRCHELVRADVFEDERVKKHLATADEDLKQRIDLVLDEMCHQLSSQCNPSRRLKFAGVFFLKCITQIYNGIYVNNHLLPLTNGYKLEQNLFKDQYLSLMRELPIIILPTHRSYMDFLIISYIMTHYELPLPIVATGDNFKALGKTVTNYLKSTGGFLVRRSAQKKRDVEANLYYDLLRAYVHSVLKGGENPLEFFMEGTRTRVGQVLRPKTGLLSMVVDTILDDIVDDVYILPVAINYQRPIEEQLYMAENTPEINRRKPRESTRNLINAFSTIMKRKYGKVYVRFLHPFKLSDYFNDWKQATKIKVIDSSNRDVALHDFTNSLASKVCLNQATSNILMPFNLIACSLLARSFLQDSYAKRESEILRLPLKEVVQDFYSLEALLISTQHQFMPGWQSRLEILDEFELDRDGIIRSTSDRRYVEFNSDALTFQTMLYYSNQLIQVLLPVAICFLALGEANPWQEYKCIRTLLSHEFFTNELFMRQEFNGAVKALEGNTISSETKDIVVKHLNYFIRCYLRFFNYLRRNEAFDTDKFFGPSEAGSGEPGENLYISKDMLRKMTSLVKDEAICEQISKDSEQLRLVNPTSLYNLIEQYNEVLKLAQV